MLNTEIEDSDSFHWYVMRTLGRFCEASVKQRLEESGIRYYQAMKTVVKTVKGKKNLTYEPVIPNLLFVYGSKNLIMPYTAVGNKFQFVYNRCSGKQADCLIVPSKAMEDFIRVADSNGFDSQIVMPDEISLEKGQRIRMIGGALDGVEGYFVKKKGSKRKKLLVVLEGYLGVYAEVEPDMIEIF